jgi:hypothetical protein
MPGIFYRPRFLRQLHFAGGITETFGPDVVRVFPDAEPVNSSLRALADIIRRRKPLPRK